MNKEEILKKVIAVGDKQHWIDIHLFDNEFDGDVDIVFDAMDEYAKQEAIGFGNFLNEKNYRKVSSAHPLWGIGIENSNHTTEELYSLYLKSKQ